MRLHEDSRRGGKDPIGLGAWLAREALHCLKLAWARESWSQTGATETFVLPQADRWEPGEVTDDDKVGRARLEVREPFDNPSGPLLIAEVVPTDGEGVGRARRSFVRYAHPVLALSPAGTPVDDPGADDLWHTGKRVSSSGGYLSVSGEFGAREVNCGEVRVTTRGARAYEASLSPGGRFVAVVSVDHLLHSPTVFDFLGGGPPLMNAFVEVFAPPSGRPVARFERWNTRFRPSFTVSWVGETHLFVLLDDVRLSRARVRDPGRLCLGVRLPAR